MRIVWTGILLLVWSTQALVGCGPTANVPTVTAEAHKTEQTYQLGTTLPGSGVQRPTPVRGEHRFYSFGEHRERLFRVADRIWTVNADYCPSKVGKTCNYKLRLKQDDEINAFAGPSEMVFTTGMMQFLQSDDEIAVVVGHELAHHTGQHIHSKMGNQIVGALTAGLFAAMLGGNANTVNQFGELGAGIGRMAYSQGFEHEADYVGLYYAARAGYDPFVAEGLWRRMGMMDPKAIVFARTHPTTAERAVSMRQTATEINDKRALGLPLIPAFKEQDAAASTSMTEAEIEDRQFGKDD